MAIDPVTLSAIISGGTGLVGKLFGGDGGAKENAKISERMSKEDRRLSRDEMLMELLLLAGETDFQNRVAERNAGIIAKEMGEHTSMYGGQASPMTIARANAGARAPEGAFGTNPDGTPSQTDADMRQLIHSNFQDFVAAKQNAKSKAASITPESLYVGKENPLDVIGREAPGLEEVLFGTGQDTREIARGGSNRNPKGYRDVLGSRGNG